MDDEQRKAVEAALDKIDAREAKRQQVKEDRDQRDRRLREEFKTVRQTIILPAVKAFEGAVAPRGHKVVATPGSDYDVRIIPKALVGTEREHSRDAAPYAVFSLAIERGTIDVICHFVESASSQTGQHASWPLAEVTEAKVFAIFVELLQRYAGK